MVVTTGAIKHAKFQLIVTTNKPTPNFLQTWCPSCRLPHQQCQSTDYYQITLFGDLAAQKSDHYSTVTAV